LLAERKLSRALLMLNLTRLVSRRHHWFLPIHKIFSFGFLKFLPLIFLVNQREKARKEHRAARVFFRRWGWWGHWHRRGRFWR
jgi:hypothetical protein